MISLKPVTKENLNDVISLCVNEDQKRFVSTNTESLAQAYVYSENAYPFAIYSDNEPVGFIMLGYYETKRYYTLWKFMIDQRYQNRGYGRQALELGIQFIKEHFETEELYTGVSLGNDIAKRLYRSVGFNETGLTEYGMEEMRLVLDERDAK